MMIYVVQGFNDFDPGVEWEVLVIDPDGDVIVIWA